jgi:hypothetical protein
MSHLTVPHPTADAIATNESTATVDVISAHTPKTPE